MTAQLREVGFHISRYKVRKVMRQLKLFVMQRRAYKSTTFRNYNDVVAKNRLKGNFHCQRKNQVWAGDITYIKTQKSWCYLAVIIDLWSKKVIGYHVSKQQTQGLVINALKPALRTRLRNGEESLIFHSDRGAQYTAKAYQKILMEHGITLSMSSTGACWDDIIVERFFGSIKNEWMLNSEYYNGLEVKKDVDILPIIFDLYRDR